MPGRLLIRTCCSFVLLSLCLSAAPLAIARNPFPAQNSQPTKNDYALIYGTVWGPENHPVAGVPIKIRRVIDKKAKWELMSDRSGEFAQRVPAAKMDYIVEADLKMPKGQPKPHIEVHIDDNERQDISLHLTKEELPSH